ncbi:MAG: adenylate/guanylate cyclase domain-containing protein [Gammaproteobacteria bacterium]|nr:adenylate/guanylate cyclase domain-containing protein [Gammaproteobacteria bacterium]
MSDKQHPTQSMAIMFADIGGSTSLYEQVGDVEAHRLVAQSLQHMETAITEYKGKLLRTVGDAALASFESCDDAFDASVAIQELHSESKLSVRIGFHFGQAIIDKGDVYGHAVNIAARISSLANPDEITTTEDCVHRLSPHLRQRAALLDFINVKGIADPLAVYRLFWRPQDESATAIQTAVSLSLRNPTNVQLRLTYQGRVININNLNPQVTIGRTADNNLAVDNHCVSRNHAVIELIQGKFILKDQSTNGTYLIKESQSAVFVRRESITVDSHGIIGAGWMPGTDDPHAIYFDYNVL